MRRDFGLHFAAWFLVGTPLLLVSGLRIKAADRWFGAGITVPEVFCYGFLFILLGSLILAWVDVFLVGTIVERLRRRR